MQAAWTVSPAAGIDFAKCARLGLRRLYVDARYITRAEVDGIHAHGLEAGLFWGADWPGEANGGTWLAQHVDQLIIDAGLNATQCAVMFDIELHDPGYMLDLLTEWRKLRPLKWTSWSPEGMQGGWFTPALVDAINHDVNLAVVAGVYTGSMQPQAADVVLKDLLAAGVQLERCQSFYDGAALPLDWQGCIFTLERAA